jgi:hypothetical protein
MRQVAPKAYVAFALASCVITVDLFALSGNEPLAVRELTALEAIANARTFLICEKRTEVETKTPYLKGSYWIVPSYGADGKRVSNLFVNRISGVVTWPDLPNSKCSPVSKNKKQ